MQKISFNDGWYCRYIKESILSNREVHLPHDAMLEEKRSTDNPGGGWVCCFEGHDYLYSKKFMIPYEYSDKQLFIEFEGVYHNAKVFINGMEAAFRPYGYTNFYIDICSYIKYGEENLIEVEAHNSDQPNSRWYSGAGIYRPVYLYVGEKKHIMMNGIKIRTINVSPTMIACDVHTSEPGDAIIEVLDVDKIIYTEHIRTERIRSDGFQLNGTISAVGNTRIEIPEANLWCPENPHLYRIRITFGADSSEEYFGIRKLDWNANDGFTINGDRVILRGGCIHHDNGVLGACTYPEAEERRVKLLMENGYNTIRSAHNPCTKSLLDICDRLGMLVMDEYTDMWYIHKTKYDYALYMQEWWEKDLKDLVDKDYNHPCVIMYSTGNEVSETAEPKGIALTKAMTEYLHQLDPQRPVTCGINIFFNFLSSIGFGVYSDEKAEKEANKVNTEKVANNKNGIRKEGAKRAVGSEFYNQLAGRLGAAFMKWGATLYPCDVKTRDAFANMDIAGYNYGIRRYRHDLKKYPERLIVGTETFCADAFKFWELAKKEKRIIGDFVWAGMDYLGEVGAGAQEYEDYAPKDADSSGWICGGGARVNLIGRQTGESAYTRVAFERSKGPIIAVKPVYQTGTLTPNAWKMTYSLQSWAWNGCEGLTANVEVYARAHTVKLFLNNRLIGSCEVKKGCTVHFKVPYEDGELKAISYDREGNEIGRDILNSAGKESFLNILPEQDSVRKQGLCYIRLCYTDKNGIWKPMEKHRINVRVQGGRLLGLGSASPYNPEGFLKSTTRTYYGEALAVVQSDGSSDLLITASDENSEKTVKIPLKQECTK